MTTVQDVLNKLPANVRLLVIAAVPAALVLISEEFGRSHSSPPDSSLQHAFTNAQLQKVSSVAVLAVDMLKGLDLKIARPESQSESACMSGLRNGAFLYVSTTLDRMRVDMETSLHMKNAEDDDYISSGILNSLAPVPATLKKVSANLDQMLAACPNDNRVINEVMVMKEFLKSRVVPLINELKGGETGKPAADAR